MRRAELVIVNHRLKQLFAGGAWQCKVPQFPARSQLFDARRLNLPNNRVKAAVLQEFGHNSLLATWVGLVGGEYEVLLGTGHGHKEQAQRVVVMTARRFDWQVVWETQAATWAAGFAAPDFVLAAQYKHGVKLEPF